MKPISEKQLEKIKDNLSGLQSLSLSDQEERLTEIRAIIKRIAETHISDEDVLNIVRTKRREDNEIKKQIALRELEDEKRAKEQQMKELAEKEQDKKEFESEVKENVAVYNEAVNIETEQANDLSKVSTKADKETELNHE